MRVPQVTNRRLIVPEIAVGQARKAPCERQVGVQRNSAFVQDLGFVRSLAQKAADVARKSQSACIGWVQNDRSFGPLHRAPG